VIVSFKQALIAADGVGKVSRMGRFVTGALSESFSERCDLQGQP